MQIVDLPARYLRLVTFESLLPENAVTRAACSTLNRAAISAIDYANHPSFPRAESAVQLPELVNNYFAYDARDLGNFLPDSIEFIDVTLTSPPYWNLKDYGSKGQIGYGQSYNQYLDEIEAVFQRVYTATKSSGSLWIVADTFKQKGELRLLPFDIATRVQKSGWLLQDIIIWQKDRTLPWSHQGKLRNIFEYIVCFTKSHNFRYDLDGIRDVTDLKDYWVRYPERYSPGGKTPSRTWSIPIPRQGSWGQSANYVRHACPLPMELVERILRLTTRKGDLVFDPFAGSGAVLASAKAMGRQFLGTDLNPRYRRMFYEDVLPTVVDRYKARKHIDEQALFTRRRFTAAVLMLRCLKFPKELVRLYRRNVGSLKSTAVIAFASPSRRSLVLIFCFSSGGIPKEFVEQATKLASQKPLSKYGIQVEIRAVSSIAALRRALRLRVAEKRLMSIYRMGRFYSRTERMPLKMLMSTDLFTSTTPTELYPRIISTLDIQIEPDDPGKFFATNNGN